MIRAMRVILLVLGKPVLQSPESGHVAAQAQTRGCSRVRTRGESGPRYVLGFCKAAQSLADFFWCLRLERECMQSCFELVVQQGVYALVPLHEALPFKCRGNDLQPAG